MKYKLKLMCKNIKLFTSLPHVWILLIIVLLSVISCCISIICLQSNPFMASIFSNIFAGLVTGIVLNLVTTIKAITSYRMGCLIEWLEKLHEKILEYIEMRNKMIFKRKHDFKDDEEFYNYIYDTLCCGNNVNVIICQETFNYVLPFNSYKYIKNKFGYDARSYSEKNEDIREQIIVLDSKEVTTDQLCDLFESMDRNLRLLNMKILEHIRYLKQRRNAINISLM